MFMDREKDRSEKEDSAGMICSSPSQVWVRPIVSSTMREKGKFAEGERECEKENKINITHKSF